MMMMMMMMIIIIIIIIIVKLNSFPGFSLHIRSSSFAVSAHNVITNLHIFLFLCNSFLLLAG